MTQMENLYSLTELNSSRAVMLGSTELGNTEILFQITGALLILLVIAQLAFWIGGSIQSILAERKKIRLHLKILEQKLAAAKLDRTIVEGESGWNGYRTFCVSKLVRESENITSVYLTPQDRRPLPFFKPGQYLTFAFEFPDQKKPVVRCYSLSDAPNSEFYRCTIKRVTQHVEEVNPKPLITATELQTSQPPEGLVDSESPASFGIVSSFINQQMREGDLVQVKAPAGHFHVELSDDRPIVLLAGGIGISPLFSMLASVVKFQPHRRIVLFYGGKNSGDFGLKTEIDGLSIKHRNLHVVKCFSSPLESDRMGTDYDVKGWVTIDLLKATLPSSNFEYYLCGPGPFMASLYRGLTEWNVPRDHIHSEAFGPASLDHQSIKPSAENCDRPSCRIRFARSKVEVDFDEQLESILEAAEQIGVDINSGCRAGNCGSCEISILKGKIQTLKETGAKPSDGHALSCVTTPDGDLEVDA